MNEHAREAVERTLECKPGMESWMDYQQSCGETGLRVWQELYWLAAASDATIRT